MRRNKIYCIIFAFILTIYCSVMQNNNFVYAEDKFDLTSKSAILMDYNSQTIIFEKDKDKKLPIASMVKLMTIYITFQNLETGKITYEQEFTSSEHASGMGGSQVFIDPYVNYSVKDLLRSVIMASANDASVALAEGISGSESEFVDLMNEKRTSMDRIENLSYLAEVFPVDLYSTSRLSLPSGIRCHGTVTYMQEMPQVFRGSKINLNFTLRSPKRAKEF